TDAFEGNVALEGLLAAELYRIGHAARIRKNLRLGAAFLPIHGPLASYTSVSLRLHDTSTAQLHNFGHLRPSEYESPLASRQILRRNPRRTPRARAMSRNVAVLALCQRGAVAVSQDMWGPAEGGDLPAADNHPMTHK
ncbi:unnamed protein product, partial [Symbiodinium necroappetens]